MTEIYLKTQQVADALQIGVSTVKRWVDSGQLQATRTVGKHRLIPLSEALRFAQSRNLSTARFQLLAEGREAPAEPVVQETVRQTLVELLKEGKAAESKRLIEETYRKLGSAARLADELIQPVMERIGHGWMVGRWDVYEEHQASRIVVSALTSLINSHGPASPQAPLALGATPSGDTSNIALSLGILTLSEAGWQVRDLGSNLPLESLAEAVRTYEPRLVFLSISYITDVDAFVASYERFYDVASSVGVAVMLGGRAVGSELRTKLKFASFGERMTHLAELGRQLARSNYPSATANDLSRLN